MSSPFRKTRWLASLVSLFAGALAFAADALTFRIVEESREPVIDSRTPDAATVQLGFEGGMALKHDGRYHLFMAEMVGEPFWANMALAHWSSADGLTWRRERTLAKSGENIATNPRGSVWAPMVVYDEKALRWNLFYVTYRGDISRGHHGGRLWRATSTAEGPEGLNAPFENDTVILEKGPDSEAWEGQQGPDSFFPYTDGQRWFGFYGGHNYDPISPWLVGLVEAPSLAGPWRRRPDVSPSAIDDMFVENPVVQRLANGTFLALYDSDAPSNGEVKYVTDALHVGGSLSRDGEHWAKGFPIRVTAQDQHPWSKDIRTPLGLIPEGNNEYTLFYTAEERGKRYWSVGRVRLRLEQSKAKPTP